MQQQIEKLKETKAKLKKDFDEYSAEYKIETKRIDQAIRNFEKGMSALSGTAKPKRQKSYSEIENILSENGALHIKELVKKLNERGFPMTYPSVSGLLQLYAKSNKKFIKVAPATYGLIESKSFIKPEFSAGPNTDNNPDTAVRKKPSNKPNANVQKNSNANGGSDPEIIPAERVAEKQTIVYEFEEIDPAEAGGTDGEH